jgi:hypothetical protein
LSVRQKGVRPPLARSPPWKQNSKIDDECSAQVASFSVQAEISIATGRGKATMATPVEQSKQKDGYDFSLVDIILFEDERRHISLADYCSSAPTEALLEECEELDEFFRTSDNLYEKVRALFFLYAIHRFHLSDLPATGDIPYEGYKNLLDREFTAAIDVFLKIHRTKPSKAISSALAKSYYHLGFQSLGM